MAGVTMMLLERRRRAIHAENECKLEKMEFSKLRTEKQCAVGTREWLLNDIKRWLLAGKAKLFWLKAGGGTGKTVVSVELLDRLQRGFESDANGRFFASRSPVPVAYHFFRYNDTASIKLLPLLGSLCAHLRDNLKGFEDELTALLAGRTIEEALGDSTFESVFATLLRIPLQALHEKKGKQFEHEGKRVLLLFDGLDELPEKQALPF